MTVEQLMEDLKKYPLWYKVHIDMMVDEDRHVVNITSLRQQPGFDAVAIDCGDYDYVNDDGSAGDKEAERN